jgi:ABC-type multidrug transport system fused ATPase/permease subunit
MESLGGAAIVALHWYGQRRIAAGEAINGGMAPGAFLAFIFAAFILCTPIKRLSRVNANLQQAIAELFVTMAAESPLVEPDLSSHDDERAGAVAALIQRDTGLTRSNHRYPGWLGIESPSIRAAVWMMRALVASNVLSRREGTTLFVPINAALDPHGKVVARMLADVHRIASARGVL